MQQSQLARLWRMWDHGLTDSNKMADWAQGYQLTNIKETLKDVKNYAAKRRRREALVGFSENKQL